MSQSVFEDQLLSPAFFSDPYPTYHRLRSEAPVYWSDALGGWVLTRYEDVVSILRRPELYSSTGRVSYLLRQLPEAARREVELLERHYTLGLAHSDPPDHTRLRTLLSKAFTSRLIEARQPRIQALVDQLLDRVEGSGRMDIIHDLAYPLPATIIAEIIGAPAEDIDLFRQWAIGINRLFESGGRVTPASVAAAQSSLVEMREYIGRLIIERRRRPGDDVLSHLVAAEQQADRLSVAELVSTAVTLFVAGHETTTHLIGNGMLALLRQPDQLQKLKENPALISSAVEEMLRYDTAVQRGWRIAAGDIEIDGCRIKKGELVLPMLGAANRDPAQFPEPDRFDICRQDNKHLGFGYGIHFCLGAPLARLETPIAINTLLRRFPNLRLETENLTWRQDIALRGLIELPVIF